MKTLVTALILGLVLTACAKRREGDPNASNTQSASVVASFSKVISSREILHYYGVALNVDAGADQNLVTEFTNLYPTLPQNGDSAYTSTVSRMFTNFAMRMCQNSMNIESQLTADRRVVFRFVNLTIAPNSFTGNDLEARMSAFIKLIAFRLYGSEIPSDEYALVYDFYRFQRSLVTQDAAGARDLAVQICALVGTTPRAIMKM